MSHIKNWESWKNKEYLDKDKLQLIKKFYTDLFNLYNIKHKKMNVLEIGCGHGIYTLVFIDLVKHITAIDPEKKLIDLLNEKIKDKKVETFVSNCDDFRSDKKFDLVIFSRSFFVVKNKQKCLLNFTKMLKHNGYILVLEPLSLLILDKKFKNQKNDMIETMETLVRSHSLKLVHFMISFGSVIYLLKKN